ncbi:MarR family transcriptional regulator [Dyella japonica]|uniref:MarR family transcriptional regulator n=1 Tax=Dyella japonica A8 TaxID=1217721 RepID=A0A075JYK4_9GAMM|nr:MarR family transcriptional regulator [Dyella japonica]AIF46537.1 MarR family transcriptional regulator [Dyella japonica A8]
MSSFLPTEQRLAVTRQRYPAFPRDPAVLIRLIKHIFKRVHDDANAMLRPYGINHPEYNLLMMLYGTEGYTLHPTELADAAGEKSANITRLTNELADKGLIARNASDEDRRKVALTLTKEGVDLIESFLPDVCTLLVRQVGDMQPREMLQLERLLKRFLTQLERD